MTAPKEFSYSRYTWQQFKKNTPAVVSSVIVVILLLVALLADFIANDQPLYAKYRGKVWYPALTSIYNPSYTDSVFNKEAGVPEVIQFDVTDWRQLQLDEVIWAPIPYSPAVPDRYNREYASPTGKQLYKNPEGNIVEAPYHFRHHLGTNKIGLDLAAGLIHGTRVSLRVGIVAMGIAAFLGILLGAISGYYGDYRLKTWRGRYYMVLIFILLGFFYAFIVRKYALADAAAEGILPSFGSLIFSFFILFVFILIGITVGYIFKWIPWFNKKISVPADTIISRLIEIVDSMPKLLLIITLAALFLEKSLYLVMAIIGLTMWTSVARFARAEFLRARNMNYVEAAKALGYTDRRIIFRHALPNAIAPVFVAIAFGIASAILIESSLSFLGIGVPDEVVTWGSLLSAARQQFDAWWMVVFPGLAIFITVTAYNLIGEGLRDALDPKLKR